MRMLSRPDLPLTVEAVRRQVRQDFGDDDLLLEEEIRAAADYVETATRRLFAPRAVEFTVERSDWSVWWFPVCPLVSVEDVAVMDPGGTWIPIPDADWRLLNPLEEPRLTRTGGAAWPAWASGAPIRVRGVAGHADAQGAAAPDLYPGRLVKAVALVVRDWYLAGLEPGDGDLPRVSVRAHDLLRQSRYQRPRELI